MGAVSTFIPPLHWLRETGSRLEDITASDPVPREFVRVTGGSGLIAHVQASGIGNNMSPHLPTGIKFQTAGSDYEVRLATMRNFRMAYVPGKYTNGDGFATELQNERIFFNTCKGIGNGDAGFDLKGPDWRLHNCLASENPHNVRLWSRGRATGKLISQNPKLPDSSVQGLPFHIHVCVAVEHMDRQDIVIEHLHAQGAGVLLRIETKGKIPPRIIIGSHNVTGVSKLVLASGPAPEVVWLSGPPKLS